MPKKKKIEDPFSYLENFFSSDPNMINLFNALVRELANSLDEQSRNPQATYGINVTINALQGQGDAPKAIAATEQKEEREPLVDVISNEKQIMVIAEVPGASKSDIKLNYTPKFLEILVDGQNSLRKYFKQVSLPSHLGSRGISAKYTNGVLEVIMTKGRKISMVNDIKID